MRGNSAQKTPDTEKRRRRLRQQKARRKVEKTPFSMVVLTIVGIVLLLGAIFFLCNHEWVKNNCDW